MTNEDNIKKLAMLYFEGKTTDEENEAVWNYITATEDNMDAFRTWENEWADSHIPEKTTETAWNDLMRKASRSRKPQKPTHAAKGSFIWKIAAVAATVALVAVLGYRTLSYNEIKYIVCSTPNGNRTQIELPDGTTIWLNAGSRLRYPDNFGDKSRDVELEGEAYFDVTRNDKLPFNVHTSQYDIIVKGTKFDVSAYTDEETVSATLFEGRIDINLNGQVTEVLPGEQVIYNKKTKILNKVEIGQHAKSWTNGDIIYRNITLDDFTRTLSRLYDVNISITNPETGKMTISAVLQNDETIDEVISALKRITNKDIIRSGKDIKIN